MGQRVEALQLYALWVPNILYNDCIYTKGLRVLSLYILDIHRYLFISIL